MPKSSSELGACTTVAAKVDVHGYGVAERVKATYVVGVD